MCVYVCVCVCVIMFDTVRGFAVGNIHLKS